MSGFDRNMARLLLEICRFTYAAGFADAANANDRNDALAWIRSHAQLQANEPAILNGSKTSVACVATLPDRNIVSYMGTKTQFNTPANARKSIADWEENLDLLLVPFSMKSEQLGIDGPAGVGARDLGGKVHSGFLSELQAVQALVVRELLKNGGRNRPVIVTGHSQGGAEAALATRTLLAGGFNVECTYTFAAPRPGNAAFVATIPDDMPVHRIEFGDDIVPHLPPAIINKRAKNVVDALHLFPALSGKAGKFLDLLGRANSKAAFTGLGKLCYGSNKTRALRIDLDANEEDALFYDRVWSIARHPERWAEHHHLAGTSEEVGRGIKGNYTALVSNFTLVK